MELRRESNPSRIPGGYKLESLLFEDQTIFSGECLHRSGGGGGEGLQEFEFLRYMKYRDDLFKKNDKKKTNNNPKAYLLIVAIFSELGTISVQFIKFLYMKKFNPTVGENIFQDEENMNSLALQSSHYEVYKDFFNTHNIVMSGDSVLTWGPDISHGVSVLRIKQKLPMKTYCGANFNTSGKVTFRSIFVYDIVHRDFKQERFLTSFKYNVDKISIFLQDFLKIHGYTG